MWGSDFIADPQEVRQADQKALNEIVRVLKTRRDLLF